MTGALRVLFVRVSVLVLATKVSAPVGTVTVPLFDMDVITGVVKVLFVRVCVSSNCTILAFVIEAILVAVDALPVISPTNPIEVIEVALTVDAEIPPIYKSVVPLISPTTVRGLLAVEVPSPICVVNPEGDILPSVLADHRVEE